MTETKKTIDKIVPYLKAGKAVPEYLIQEYSDELIEDPQEHRIGVYDLREPGSRGIAYDSLMDVSEGPILVIQSGVSVSHATLGDCLEWVYKNVGYKSKSAKRKLLIKNQIIRSIYEKRDWKGIKFVDMRGKIKLNNIIKPQNVDQKEWEFYRECCYSYYPAFPQTFHKYFKRKRDSIPGKPNRLLKIWEEPFQRWLDNPDGMLANPVEYVPRGWSRIAE